MRETYFMKTSAYGVALEAQGHHLRFPNKQSTN